MIPLGWGVLRVRRGCWLSAFLWLQGARQHRHNQRCPSWQRPVLLGAAAGVPGEECFWQTWHLIPEGNWPFSYFWAARKFLVWGPYAHLLPEDTQQTCGVTLACPRSKQQRYPSLQTGKGSSLALKAPGRTFTGNPRFQTHKIHHPEDTAGITRRHPAAEGCPVLAEDRKDPHLPAEKTARRTTVRGVSWQESLAL